MGKFLYDERFKYVDYHVTDLKKRFDRVRREQREAAERQKAAQLEATQKVRKMK